MNTSSSNSSSSSGGDAVINSPTATIGSGGLNGVTHPVVVAPTAGVLRFVLFAVEAAVGNNVEHVLGADLHTVTKGSALQLCNQSQDSTTFNTGLQNQGLSYLQPVNNPKPMYFYGAHPGHCTKGVFGIINPLLLDNLALQAGSAQTMNTPKMGLCRCPGRQRCHHRASVLVCRPGGNLVACRQNQTAAASLA
jgi:hypothetical protein